MISRQLDEEAIFHIARRIADRQARADYLEQVCGDNTALLTRVRALLEVHEKEQDFLRSAAPEATATLDAEPITEAPGTEIGRYRLMEQIGEGGMGVVFVAEQRQPLRRKVALKVIKPGMDSKAVVARFEAERQALALMDHPNIAHVLDAGSTAAGRPYFVMEYVRGVPITEYCDQNRLTIRERLELFIQVCQAIQHAHQKGIVHRDIKPSNVLVTLHDGKPVPKVIDFGVAKALNTRLTDRTIYTAHMQVIGTLMYMSPEQAEMSGLDVDTRADVYGLGVLLYELLTGTTPFQKEELDQAGFDEQRRIIREKEPQRASLRISSLGETATTIAEQRKTDARKLHQQIRGDLDWIVMKALEKDRTRRYETASGFAADVQRFLCDEPIEARPPSARYYLKKLARRHRVKLAVSMIAAIAVFSVLLGVMQVQVAEISRRQMFEKFGEQLLEHGYTLIMTAQPDKAKRLIKQLEDENARDYADRLQALSLLHEHDSKTAIQLLEPAVHRNPGDAGLRAMLTDAYDQAGRIDDFLQSHAILKRLDTSELQSVELIYAALANIVEPKHGYELADRAVKENPASPYARLVRGRMAANWVFRSLDASTEETHEASAHLIDQALDDVHSLRWLHEHDERIPPLALSVYLFAAKARRNMGDPRWQQTLHMADDVVKLLEAGNPRDWEAFFLAEYYYENKQHEMAQARVWDLLESAAVRDKNDYAKNFFLALCHEMGQSPSNELRKSVSHDHKAVFGKYGLGCWYALNAQHAQAREQVEELRRMGTIGAVVNALCVLNLLKDEAAAIDLVNEYRTTATGREQIASVDFIDRHLYEFFEAELIAPPVQRQDARGELLRYARESDYPAAYESFAQWAIGIRCWARNQPEEALRHFAECAQQGQFEFPHSAWSRAILARRGVAGTGHSLPVGSR